MQGESNAKVIWTLPSRSSISTPCHKGFDNLHTRTDRNDLSSQKLITSDNTSMVKDIGQLVVLGFDVTVFTPAPYQRHRL